MERSKQQLLELTRSSLWGGDPDSSLFEEGVNWAEVLQLAKEQTLLGLISSSIERLPLSLSPMRNDRLKLHQLVSLNRQLHSHQIEVLAEILKLVKRAGVSRPVLLKGFGVGLNYPDPTLRMCGDIDLYVGDKHYLKVLDFLSAEIGIEIKLNSDAHHFNFEFMRTHIEIHRYPTTPISVSFRSCEFMEWSTGQLEGDELRLVEIGGISVYLPPYNFDFIFIFYHSWRHFFNGGVGLRQLCDWSCYVSTFADKFDRAELMRIIKLFKLYIPISLFATICVRELGVSADKFDTLASTTESKYNKVLDRIWSGGNFGHVIKKKRKKNRTIFEKKYRSLGYRLHDIKFLFDINWRYSIMLYTPIIIFSVKKTIKQYKTLADKL